MFLRLGISESYVGGLVFLILGLVILRFGGQFSYVWPIVIDTFRGYSFLHFGASNSSV